jgi:hypothetical protein
MRSSIHRPNTGNKTGSHHGPRNASSSNKPKFSKRDQAIINKIVNQFTSRSRVDIDKWRAAIAEAENDRYPKRDKWGLIVKDLDIDAHWSSQVLIRKLSVMRKPFKIVEKKSRKELPEKTQLFKAPWFYYLMSTGLDAKFFGTQVVEIQDLLAGNQKKDAIYKIPIRHLVPDNKEILYKSSSNTGYFYGDDPYVIEFCEDVFLGLLYKATPHIIWKRNAEQSWAEFCEKFGIPMRYATTNKRDKATIDRIELMLDKLGSAAQAVFPEGTVLDFQEAKTQDAFEVFDKLIERANSEISKLINAVTMISDNGSSKSQSQVHQEINQKIIDSDASDFAGTMNWIVGPQLYALGYGFNPETEEWIWDETEVLSLGALWNIVQGILKFYEIDQNWLVEKFAIPITGIRKTPLPDAPTSGNIPNNMAELEKVINDTILKAIQSATLNFNSAQSKKARSSELFDMAAYQALLSKHSKGEALKVSNSVLDSLFLKAVDAFFKNPSNTPSTLNDGEWNDLYTHVANQFWSGITSGFGQDLSNPDLTTADEQVLKQLRENIYTFSAYKNYQLLLSLNKELLDENGKIREWADFKTKAQELNNQYNVNWLSAEYDTAIASAQFQARYSQFVEEADQYDVMFQTVGDDRVRDSHQVLDGIVAEATDEIVMTLATPLAFRCRCEWIQIARGSRVRTDKSKIQVPERTRGLSKKIGEVYTNEHPYYDGVKNTDKNSLENLATDTIKKFDE